MSFREKTAWITLVTLAVVFGCYFFTLWRAWNGSDSQVLIISLTIGAVIALVIAVATLMTVAALLSPKQAKAPADERETLIDLKAERLASYTLAVGVVCVIATLLMGWNAFLAAALLQAALVIAELVKAGAQIAYFRAGV